MKIHSIVRVTYLVFVSLCGLFFLAECNAETGKNIGQTEFISTQITVSKPQTTIKPNLFGESLAPTHISTQEFSIKNSQKILLNVTSTQVDPGECYPQGSTEVWESGYPFSKKQVLLAADPLKNYFAPTYSPDGQWIAYIESIPDFENLGSLANSDSSGNDSIWIMRHDGSEKHRVSKLFTSFSVKDLHYCYPQSRIYPILTWSTDGKYIYFSDFQSATEGNIINYYILDVQTKESFLFNSSKWNTLYDFFWGSESGQFIYESGGNYWTNRITTIGIDQSKANLLSFSLKIGNEDLDWISGLTEPILISHNESKTEWGLWQFDIAQKIWMKKIEYKGDSPRFGTFWGIYKGNNDNLFFIDLNDLKIVNSIPYKNRINDLVYSFIELNNAMQEPIISVMDRDTNDIWGIDPYLSKEMYKMVNWDSLDSENRYSIVDQYPSWSWSP